MLGLKRGTVKLYEHQKEWETEALNTICRLQGILGTVIKDIQHVGSTSVPSIKAKPIIDIAVAVDDFGDILSLEDKLKAYGFYYRPNADLNGQLLFACGSFYDGSGDLQTHFIHVVLTDSMEWKNYVNFRDYLNKTPLTAREYENLKIALAEKSPVEGGRVKYTEGKHAFIAETLRKALVSSYLGKTVVIKIDRPVGYVHKTDNQSLTYPVNYGYVPGVLGGDGEELDVYLLGVDRPVYEYEGRIIAAVHRKDDIEDKLVAAPLDMSFDKEEISAMVDFAEKYYDIEIEMP